MATAGVSSVLFDLFDTLVLFDRERLPRLVVHGREVRSTAGHLHAVLQERLARDLTLEACYDALIASWQDAERRRAVDHREVPAQERFGRWLERLAIDADERSPELVAALLDTHRRELSKAAEFPSHHGHLLERLAERFRLAVVSNFDYSPTALGILDAAGVSHLFETIVVSDQVGWRKPKPDIFHVALGTLGVAPSEALFVGDRVDIDVVGAHAVGMPVAWINRHGDPLPQDIAPPTFEIRDLAELGPILGMGGPDMA
ncbi:MAG: HAD family hydrolase [Candidatus Rokubacteria bacterium]|nr:HAD family hydrolase [Candidatus Rokubacteria bacterium]